MTTYSPAQDSHGSNPRSTSGRSTHAHQHWYSPARIWALLKDTVSDWSDDSASRLAASLAYYTLLSIAPLVVLCVSIAGFVFGDDAARGEISHQVSSVVGSEAGSAVQSIVANARAPAAGIIGSVIGIAVLLFGASNVFGELQSALNVIWEVQPKPGRGIVGVIKDRFFSFTMVLGVAFLLLVSLVLSAGLAAAGRFFSNLLPFHALFAALNFLVNFGVTTVLFALIFKVIPDVKIQWRDVWVGAIITSALFSLGRFLLGLYIGRAGMSSSYGAAGSLVALVVWVYYSAQILFFGAEFTQVYARARGSRIEPSSNAIPAPDAKPTATSGTATSGATEKGAAS